MTREKKWRQDRSLVNGAVGKLVVAITVLMALFSLPSTLAKNKPEDFTQVYTHTYDEVFQAAQEAIERMGMFVTEKDKDKGMISGNGHLADPPYDKVVFELHIEPVSPKPEVRVTVDAKARAPIGRWFTPKDFSYKLLAQTQKVLATYK